MHGVARDLGDVALLEINEALRDRQQRRHAARDEVLADAEADHERARDARHDDALGILGVEHEQRVRADEALHRQAQRFEQIVALLQIVVDEMRGDLGVGLGLELVALGDELVFERLVVLDDAVVNDGDAIARQDAGARWLR